MHDQREQDYGDLSVVYAEIMRVRQISGSAAGIQQCNYWRQYYPLSFQLLLFETQYTFELADYARVWQLLAELELLRPGSMEASQYRTLCAQASRDAMSSSSSEALSTDVLPIGGQTEDSPVHSGSLSYNRLDGHLEEEATVHSKDTVANPFVLAQANYAQPGTGSNGGGENVTQDLSGLEGFDGFAGGDKTLPLSTQSFVVRLESTHPQSPMAVQSGDLTVPVPQMNSAQMRVEQLRWERVHGGAAHQVKPGTDAFESLSTEDFGALSGIQTKAIRPIYASAPSAKALATIVEEDDGFHEPKSMRKLLFSRRSLLIMLLCAVVAYALMFVFIVPKSWEKRVLRRIDGVIQQAKVLAVQGDVNSLRQSIITLNNADKEIKSPAFYSLIKPFLFSDGVALRLEDAADLATWQQTLLAYFHEPSQQPQVSGMNLARPRLRLAQALNTYATCERLTAYEELAQGTQWRRPCFEALGTELEALAPQLDEFSDFWALMGSVALEQDNMLVAQQALAKAKAAPDESLCAQVLEIRIYEKLGEVDKLLRLLKGHKTLSPLWAKFEILRYNAHHKVEITQDEYLAIQPTLSPRMRSQLLYWRAAHGLVDYSDKELQVMLDQALGEDPQNCDASALRVMLQFFDRSIELERFSFVYDSLCRGSSAAIFIDNLSALAQGRSINENQLFLLAKLDPLGALFIATYLAINADVEMPLKLLTSIQEQNLPSPLSAAISKAQLALNTQRLPSEERLDAKGWLSAARLWFAFMQRPLKQNVAEDRDFLNQLIALTPYCERAVRCFANLQNNASSSYSALTSMCRDENPVISPRARLCHTQALVQARQRIYDLRAVIRLAEEATLSSPALLRSLLAAYLDPNTQEESTRSKIEAALRKWEALGFDANELLLWQAQASAAQGKNPPQLQQIQTQNLTPLLQLQALQLQLAWAQPNQSVIACDKFLNSTLNQEAPNAEPPLLAHLELTRMLCYAILDEKPNANKASSRAALALRSIPNNIALKNTYTQIVRRFTINRYE